MTRAMSFPGAKKPRKKKRQPRRYHYDDMDAGVMSLEEHVAAELAGDVITLNVRLAITCRAPRGLVLDSVPWLRGSDDPADPGYVIQLSKAQKDLDPYRLVVIRMGTEQKWWALAPREPGEYRFRFRHDDRTVVVLVTVVS